VCGEKQGVSYHSGLVQHGISSKFHRPATVKFFEIPKIFLKKCNQL